MRKKGRLAYKREELVFIVRLIHLSEKTGSFGGLPFCRSLPEYVQAWYEYQEASAMDFLKPETCKALQFRLQKKIPYKAVP